MHLTGTLMKFCLCLAWMQTVHIESLFVYPLTRDFMAVGFIWASRWCQILDSEIVRNFRVDLILAAIGALDDSIIGSIVGSIVGELSLILLFPFLVVNDGSAVVGTMIYMPLISFPARLQEDGEVMKDFPFWNIVVCPPKSNWLSDTRESQKVGVWRTSTWKLCMMSTTP